MRLLLDTHALVWWYADDARLTPAARAAIADDGNTIFASAASAWEVATKGRLGKWPEGVQAVERYFILAARNGFEHLPVSPQHGLRAGSFRVQHRDPFDRMLAAQAELEQLILVTHDPEFAQFGTHTLW